MLILGIDTSCREATIALLRAADSAAEMETVHLVQLADGRASELLMPAIAALLESHAVEKCSLSLIAVASGPGSFTGLRVAVATAKGLAEAFDIPVVAVSVLETVALKAPAQGRAVAALDAQRDEVFYGEYIADRATGTRRVHEEIASIHDLAAQLGAAHGASPQIITPDEALACTLRAAGLQVSLSARPTAEDIARIAFAKFLAGERSDVSTLDANYLRRSDAEIVFSRKLGSRQP
jgi:tRNA threonylcarbamoyladenosine biosynthesis protein TsaB